MRIFKLSILIALLLVSSYLQGQDIEASETEGCAPLVGVEFDSPANAVNINWDFGDGASANVVDPVHTFIEPGVYEVVYTAIIGGNDVEESLTITVFGNPVPAFVTDGPLSGCTGLVVNFEDQSLGAGGTSENIVSWEWDFGDGAVDVSDNQTPSHTYEIPGTYDVGLNITDINGCDSTLILTDYISVSNAPLAAITTLPATPFACEPPLEVNFSGANSVSNAPQGEALTFEWDFGNGTTSTIMTPPAVTYTEQGDYLVSLTVTDVNGCSTTTQAGVSVNQPTASFEPVGAVNGVVCQYVEFENNSSPGLYAWDYGDGNSGSLPFHEYESGGTYDVTLTVSAGPCVNDTTVTIIVEEIAALFEATPTYSCEEPVQIQYTDLSTNAVSWEWYLGNDSINVASIEQNPLYLLELADTNQYTLYPDTLFFKDSLVVTSASGCTDYFVFENHIALYPLSAHHEPLNATQGCAPLTVTFVDSTYSAEEIIAWSWDFGDGNTNTANETEVTHTFEEAGEYEVILTAENAAGCVDTSYVIPVSVGVPPSPNFEIDPIEVCPLDTVYFTDLTEALDSAEIWHFDADGGHMWHCPNDPNPFWTFMYQAGLQDISLTAGYNECYGDITIEDAITVKGPIGRIDDYSCSCETPYEYAFFAELQEVDKVDWDFGDGTIWLDTLITDPVHTYTESGDYWVKLTSYNETTGCAPYMDSILVKARNLQAAWTSDTLVCVGAPVFFDASASIDVDASCYSGFQWYFDDGWHPINIEDSSYTYTFGGNGPHDVELIVKDVNGCKDTLIQTVHAYEVNANFTLDPDFGCIPLDVDFFDNSTGDTTLVSWEWDFGDGGTSQDLNPSHTYGSEPIAESFLATLTVTDVLDCPGSFALPVTPSIPKPSFEAVTDRTICVGESVTFQPEFPNESWEWDFGDGGSSISENPTYQFDEAGTYDITLTVTDSIGCVKSETNNLYVDVQDYPTADFSSSADTLDNLCYPLLVNFTDDSGVDPFGDRTWDLGNGNPVVSDETVGTLYDQPGDYTISLVVETSYGCADSTSQSLSIEGPSAIIDAVPDLICRGDEVTFSILESEDVWVYSWDFGDGFDTTNVAPITHTYDINPPDGQTFASLVYWSPDSACSNTTTVPINFQNVRADFWRNSEFSFMDSIHCIGEEDIFLDASVNADTWSWDFGNGQTHEGQSPPPILYEEAGIYDVTLYIEDNETGCYDEITKPLEIREAGTAYALSGSACEGNSVQLQAVGGIAFDWFPPETLSATNIPNPIASPDSTTLYNVLLTDSAGCVSIATAMANIYMEPITVTLDTTIVIGDSLQLWAPIVPGANYFWSPNNDLSCTNCPNPYASPENDINYTVTIADTLGCFTTASYFNIEVLPLSSVDVPTAFTPNGDGVNDVIYVGGWGIEDLVEFRIFNRYGELVFETSELNEGWDGYFKGKLQNVESYAYTVIADTYVNGRVVKSGTFNLLR